VSLIIFDKKKQITNSRILTFFLLFSPFGLLLSNAVQPPERYRDNIDPFFGEIYPLNHKPIPDTQNIFPKRESIQYVESSPIFIAGNGDFANTASENSWPGNGTLAEPYVISDLHINGPSTTTSINIQNTNVHFQVNNCFLEGGQKGILFQNVHNVRISNTNITNCYEHGIQIEESSNISFTKNVIRKCGTNLFHPGISLSNSENTNISYNNISSNFGGGVISWDSSHDNIISYNFLSNNYKGIDIGAACSKHTISFNIFYRNLDYEIEMGFASNNNVEWNDFIGNGPKGSSQANEYGGTNIFSYNYWYEWSGPDEDVNGIIDEPYSIDGPSNNYDLFPLVSPFNPLTQSFHFITTPRMIYPNGNEALNDEITIRWRGVEDSFDHTVIYTIYYSRDAGNSWTELASGLNATTYKWTTTSVKDGEFYLIKIIAHCSSNLWMEDISDTSFSVHNTQHTLTMPLITYPDEAETLIGSVDIQWSVSTDSWEHSVTYSIYYSSDNGNIWKSLVSNITATSYNWNTTTVADGSYLVKVVAKCSSPSIFQNSSVKKIYVGNHLLENQLFFMIVVFVTSLSLVFGYMIYSRIRKTLRIEMREKQLEKIVYIEDRLLFLQLSINELKEEIQLAEMISGEKIFQISTEMNFLSNQLGLIEIEDSKRLTEVERRLFYWLNEINILSNLHIFQKRKSDNGGFISASRD
jgi:parallel beta-helix repeat protein